MKTTLVAHLAVVGLLFGSTGADLYSQSPQNAQDSDDVHDGAARPRLKLPRMRAAPAAPSAPRAPLPQSAPLGVAASGETPKLGVMIDITDDGLVVADVMEDSLAEAAGVQGGDMLLKMDGRSIDSVEDIREALSETRPGGSLGLTVVRQGQGLVKLEAHIPRPAPPAAPPAAGRSMARDGHQGGFLGVQLGQQDEGGVQVDGVVEQSAAWFAGLDEGDVLLKIGKTKVTSGQDVVGAVASLSPGTFVKVTYERDGEQQSARVRLGSRTPTPGALGSFVAPGGQGDLPFGVPVPGNAPHALPQVRVLDPDHGDWPFAVQGQGGAQVFTFDSDSDSGGNFWVSDDEDGNGPHVFSFDGLEGLGDGGSLSITIDDGTLFIDRDGEVQVLDLDELGDFEQLHEDGHHGDHDGAHGVHIENLKVLPETLLKHFRGPDGVEQRIKLRVKRSVDDANTHAQPKVRRLSFTPDAQVTTITTTTRTSEDCSTEVSDEDTGCCAETEDVQETGDVN